MNGSLLNSRPADAGEASPPVSPGRPDRWAVFLAADGIYLLILFGWTLRLGPMGRDFSLLPSIGESGTLASVAAFFAGESVLLLRFAGLAALYGMVCLIFRLTRSLTGGPWWLGSVAAVLFLAHPLKSEAVFTAAGFVELAESVLILLAVWAVDLLDRDRILFRLTGWIVPPLAAWMTDRWWEVLVLCGGWAWIRQVATRGHVTRTLPALVAVLCGGLYECSRDPAALYGLLHGSRAWLLAGWPFGLSENAIRLFDRFPVLHAVWSLLVCIGLALLARRYAGRAAARVILVTFPLAMAAGVRVDFRTFEGGAAYLIPTGLLGMAAALGFRAQLEHPRFRTRTVAVSTAVCLALMAWHSWIALDWVRAHRLLIQGRAAAAQEPESAVLAVFPDVMRVGFAPVRLAEALRCPPPYGPGRTAYALAWVELDRADRDSVKVTGYTSQGGILTVSGIQGRRPWTGYRLEPSQPEPAWTELLWRIILPRRPGPAAECAWRVTPWQEPFPERRLPFP